MNKDIITLYDENDKPIEYKLLMVIENEYKYVIYTNVDNQDIKKDLYAIKLKSFDNSETIPINDDEWKMIEKKYQEILEK